MDKTPTVRSGRFIILTKLLKISTLIDMLNIIIIFITVLGLIVGSFLNMLTIRLANDESLRPQRSYCPRCRHILAVKDLIPVLSFAWLGGRCRYCRAPISWQYPIVELATAFFFVVVFCFDYSRMCRGYGYLPFNCSNNIFLFLTTVLPESFKSS